MPLQPGAAETILIAYDDEWSIEYFGEHLRPWWRRNGGCADAIRAAASDAMAEHETVLARASAFDDALAREARRSRAKVRRPPRARVAPHYRRAQVAAGPDGAPLFFSKENFSNGCIATVDVTYPSAPLFLASTPTLLSAMIDPTSPIADDGWKLPFAAHDLGTYPKANGQTYRNYDKDPHQPIIETQMPVEECGNMLILVGALAVVENDALCEDKLGPADDMGGLSR